LSIIVPWDEVLDRGRAEPDPIVWVPPPPEGTRIDFDVVYIPASTIVTGHPGARSMGTGLVGTVQLANGERVFVTWRIQPMEEALRRHVTYLRSIRVVDKDGNFIEKPERLVFGKNPNPDAEDGTEVGKLLSVTRRGESKDAGS
jgi:hypothetical protein